MNCESVRLLLTEHLLGESAAGDPEPLRLHLAQCAACAQEEAELRATLGLLTRASSMEEVPQRIRIAADPAHSPGGWLAAFWRNSGRLAFAGGALACLAVGLLGIFRASLSYDGSRFLIAFGGQPAAGVTAPASPLPEPLSPTDPSIVAQPVASPTPPATGISRDEAVKIVQAMLRENETRQEQSTQKMIQSVALKSDERRAEDLREMAESFRYMQAAQVNMWKEQVQSQQVVGALMQRAGMQFSQ